MSQTITAVVQNQIRAVVTDSEAAPGDNTTTYDSASSTDPYTAATSVPVTFQSPFTVTLVSGAYTLDLTAIPTPSGGTYDATGKKLQKLRLEAAAGNANKVEIKNGASSGYRTDGATTASLDVVLLATQKALFEFDEGADDVGSSHKTLDFSGTGSQQIKVHLMVG